MTSQESLKKTADKMMKFPTEVVGVVFTTHAQYIEQREGEEGLGRVEKKMAELGYPIRFKDIKTFEYYPVGLADLVIITAKEIFNWKEKDVFDMGNTAPKYSFIVKFLLRYFINLERTFKEATGYWRRHFTKGELEYELHEEEKYIVLRLKYNTTHPLICVFYAGYFLRIAQYVIKSRSITVKEVKCIFKGDPYHEYVVSWK